MLSIRIDEGTGGVLRVAVFRDDRSVSNHTVLSKDATEALFLVMDALAEDGHTIDDTLITTVLNLKGKVENAG